MPKTHYKLDRSAVRKGEQRDRDAERETAERHGFYQYQRFVLVPVGQIAHQPVWNQGRIESILDTIDRGKPLPPIRADKDRGKYDITDGIHRYNASLQRGFTHIPVLETVPGDAPEMYVPPVPEKSVLRPGTYVKLTEKPYRATSLWARVEEYLGPTRRGGVIRHVYALDGIVNGHVDFVGDWHDDKFDPEGGRPPRDVLQAFSTEDELMDKRTLSIRVASRYAEAARFEPRGTGRRKKTAARPIRLPTREIKTLVKRLAQRLYQYGLPKPGRVIAQEYLPLTNVKGDEVVVEILLTGSPGRNRDPFSSKLLNGGFIKRRPEGPLMRVFVNPHLDPRTFEGFPRKVVEDELYRLLAHELTHAADIWSGKGSVGDLSGSMDDLKKHHHNHPAEIKSLMRDVVTHLEDGEYVRDLMGYGMDFNTALREALKDTKWPDIEPYLTPRNKKTILKGVYTHLQDQGLDDAQGAWRGR